MLALLDCNSFYCSCERLFRPELKRSAVVVLSNNDGCVISRSDEAKLAGIPMGAPYFMVKEKIIQNDVAVFSSNYSLYGELSHRVMDTLRLLADEDRVEVYSVDEAFLNLDGVPEWQLQEKAAEIKETVEQWTGINVSIGVAPTKVLCKVANRLAKKSKESTGCVLVLKNDAEIRESLEQTEVGDIWGVGYQYAEKLRNHGIQNAYRLSRMPNEWVRNNLGGVVGLRIVKELRGEPCLELKDSLEEKKMIASTRMFGRPATLAQDITEAVACYTSRAAEKLRRQNSATGRVEVFLVSAASKNFTYHPEKISLSAHLNIPSSDTGKILAYSLPLAKALFREGKRYLKAGVILSELVPDDSIQANLFMGRAGFDISSNKHQLMQALDNINFSQRRDMVVYAASGIERKWKMRQEMMSPAYTTNWKELKEVH